MMNEMYRGEYTINFFTKIILPNNDPQYPTRIIEKDKQIFTKKKPLQIITDNCLHGGASYEGRREAVTYHTGYSRRVPVPVYVKQKICVVPTHSPHAFDCAWICSQNFQKAEDNHDASGMKNKLSSRLVFTDGTYIDLPVTRGFLERQMTKAIHCIQLFSSL
ncbi:competence protein ComK [Evansella caseinilytica]|uniref:Competence protein ComK n=1 Tax=Evansella caseinilytica TaxID=1503961 RepID=A0A1H3S5W6_9BACI|nr:competence protein ComK [Evansella caseinilytica]SDZ33503.1 competence protein ComK [Evansella caseinilytica]